MKVAFKRHFSLFYKGSDILLLIFALLSIFRSQHSLTVSGHHHPLPAHSIPPHPSGFYFYPPRETYYHQLVSPVGAYPIPSSIPVGATAHASSHFSQYRIPPSTGGFGSVCSESPSSCHSFQSYSPKSSEPLYLPSPTESDISIANLFSGKCVLDSAANHKTVASRQCSAKETVSQNIVPNPKTIEDEFLDFDDWFC